MDENDLPHLNIRPGKKHRANDGTLPNLHVKNKQHISSGDSATSSQEQYQLTRKQQTTAPSGYSVLGYDIHTNKPVMVSQASRRQGLYIIGATGTGKTGLVENLIIQDIKQGLGVGLLDPHGDLTNAVLSRLPPTRFVDGVERITEQDVILLDIKNTQ